MSRSIRDFTASDKMKTLSATAERFFIRLLLRIDDYGNIEYDKEFLLRDLFPKHTSIRVSELAAWVDACKTARLIHLYEVESKIYIHVPEFRQKLRWPKAKYPQPLWQKEKSTKKENEAEVEEEGEGEGKVEIAPAHSLTEKILKTNQDFWEHGIRYHFLREPTSMNDLAFMKIEFKKFKAYYSVKKPDNPDWPHLWENWLNRIDQFAKK